VAAIAWERIPAWRASNLLDFRTGFAHTLRRVDRLQPALLVVCLGSTVGFAASTSGAARTLAPPLRWAASPWPSPPPPCEHAVKLLGRQGGREVAAQGV
jgi:hypothetical protein